MSRSRLLLVALPLFVACSRADKSADAQPAQPVTPAPSFDLARVDRSRQMGSESAKVWFIEGSDFECPWCKRFHDDTWPQIVRDYVNTGKVRVAFMNHPMFLRSGDMHPRSVVAAEAAMCAGAQDRFWQMHDSLFATQDTWANAPSPQPTFERLVQSLGVDLASWRNCMTSHATRPMIEQDFVRTTQAGINGTPGFVIGDSLAVSGAAPYPEFKQAIDAALARKR
jgi:protein-disulfide isomerase